VIGLVLIVKNEAAFIERCLSSAKPLISHWTIVDTGSTDDTKKIIRRTLKGIPGKLHEREFVDFGHNRTEALELAKGTGEWLLELDADMTVEAHEGLLEWLEKDPDPDVAAWQVEIVDSGTLWRLPRLIRGNLDWRYIGPVHEYLDPAGRKQRALLGLTITHHGSSRHPIQKFDHYLRLLKPGLDAGDPRAVFYSAECLRFLNCIPAAIELYEQRAGMNSFEEEAWYAQYMAARLRRNVTDLLKAYERRPHRPEPLWAAADIVRTMPSDDVLFKELR
jgi:glycosyltransferase involved in cell wall biosynthesis